LETLPGPDLMLRFYDNSPCGQSACRIWNL